MKFSRRLCRAENGHGSTFYYVIEFLIIAFAIISLILGMKYYIDITKIFEKMRRDYNEN